MVLSGHLVLRSRRKSNPRPIRTPENGGYFSQRLDGYRLESVISFRSAYSMSRAAAVTSRAEAGTLDHHRCGRAQRSGGAHGRPRRGPDHHRTPPRAICRRSPSSARASRICASPATPVKMEFDYDIFGPRPINDLPYVKDAGVVSRVSASTTAFSATRTFPTRSRRYNQLSSISAVRRRSNVRWSTGWWTLPGTFWDVITVPASGTITLAKLTVKHEDQHEKTKAPKRPPSR